MGTEEDFEEFEKHKKAYLDVKLKLATELRDLVARQDEVIAKIAALERPLKPGRVSTRWRYEYGTGKNIKSEIEPIEYENINYGWLHTGIQILREEQQYFVNKLFDPNYKTELQKKRKRERRRRWSNPKYWSDYDSEDSW